MNNDVVGLSFRFEIKWNIRSSVSALGKNRTFIFFLLEGFASLKPAIIESPVINVVPFIYSSACLDGSILDGFDGDALFLASSVCVCDNTGWGITTWLFYSVAIPCSSLSVLFSASVLNCFPFLCVLTFSCSAIYAEVSDVIFYGRYVFFYIITIFFRWEVRDQVFRCFFLNFYSFGCY